MFLIFIFFMLYEVKKRIKIVFKSSKDNPLQKRNLRTYRKEIQIKNLLETQIAMRTSCFSYAT